MLDNSTRYISFPVLNKSETVAYRSWVDSQIASNFTRSSSQHKILMMWKAMAFTHKMIIETQREIVITLLITQARYWYTHQLIVLCKCILDLTLVKRIRETWITI